jgi:superfamily I DNA/RNA helicase
MKHIYSKFQEAIFNFLFSGTGNAVVSAVAGSGKTTTIIECVNLIPPDKTALYMAFNRDTVEQVKKKNTLQNNIDFKTSHGIGYRAILKSYDFVEIDDYKYSKMIRNIYQYLLEGKLNRITEYNFTPEIIDQLEAFIVEGGLSELDSIENFQDRIKRLCLLARGMLIYDSDELELIAKIYDIDYDNGECEKALWLVQLGEYYSSKIDYTDMIYFPNRFNLKTEQYDFVFVDECQDLNKAQRLLMLKCLKPGGRFIAVGDPHQAIYGFAGADFSSFQEFVKIPNTVELPLSVCYRCDSEIIKLAKTLVPHIEFFEKNGKGVVDYDAKKENIKSGDMVLCRTNYPLIKMCLDYLKDGVKAHVRGRDIGKNIIEILRKSKTEDLSKLFDFVYTDLEKTKKRLQEKHNLSDAEAVEHQTYISYKEKIEIIELLSLDLDNVSGVVLKIEKIFSDHSDDGIQLSTIHKAKGLESDNVFIIHSDLLGSMYSGSNSQEDNIMYVAYTRAKHYLGFVTNFNAYNNKKEHDKSGEAKIIKNSNFVGVLNEKIFINLKLDKTVVSKNGAYTIYKFVDESGNVFSKFAPISSELLVGDFVKCCVKIMKHSEFGGSKENVVSYIETEEFELFKMAEIERKKTIRLSVKKNEKKTKPTKEKSWEEIVKERKKSFKDAEKEAAKKEREIKKENKIKKEKVKKLEKQKAELAAKIEKSKKRAEIDLKKQTTFDFIDEIESGDINGKKQIKKR